jgi:hypothetical protein
MAAPEDREVAVDADLSVTVDPGTPLERAAPAEARVWGDGSTLTVDVPSFAVARSLASGLRSLPGDPDRAGRLLDELGLTVRVRVRYATVATLGAGADPGALARLAGVDARISPWGLAVAAVRTLR